MYLCNGSHDFLSAMRPGLRDSVPNEPKKHTVNFITTKLQDTRNKALVYVFKRLRSWRHPLMLMF
jgi:hypothetical protein